MGLKLRTLAVLVGCAMVVAGIALVYLPAALVVGGVLIVALFGIEVGK